MKTAEKKAWLYMNGVKQEFVSRPSGKLSKSGEFMKKHPGGVIDVHNLRAVMK